MSNAPETKYTDRDVRENDGLCEAAVEYLESYAGEFEFLIDCKMRLAQGQSLSTPMVRGILNCMRVDPRVQGLPEPLPPERGTVVEFAKPKSRYRNRRQKLAPCDIEEFHDRHGGWNDGDGYDLCLGKYEINRTERNVPIPVFLKPSIVAITAQSETSLVHRPLFNGNHYANWLPKEHEWGYYFRIQRRRWTGDSWEENYDTVPMVDLHIYTACTFPRNLRNPLMLTVDQYEDMQLEEETARARCGRCFR